MAFQETTDKAAGGPDDPGPLGLPVHWDRLKDHKCPRCGCKLEEFAHVSRWTCYECGIKIPDSIIKGGRNPNNGRGYFIGLTQFHDETPF